MKKSLEQKKKVLSEIHGLALKSLAKKKAKEDAAPASEPETHAHGSDKGVTIVVGGSSGKCSHCGK